MVRAIATITQDATARSRSNSSAIRGRATAVPEFPMTVVNWPTATVVNASHRYPLLVVGVTEVVSGNSWSGVTAGGEEAIGFYDGNTGRHTAVVTPFGVNSGLVRRPSASAVLADPDHRRMETPTCCTHGGRRGYMAKRTDPEGTETRVIHDLVDFRNKRVIEIGCGNGRLTWRYASSAKSVLGIDLGAESIEAANAARPDELVESVSFQVGDVTSTDFPDGPYDVAVLALSL